MQKQEVVEALHLGMAKAVRDFHAWSGGESIKDWGVESILTISCAQALAARVQKIGHAAPLTLEQNFVGLIHFSGRQNPTGRPTVATVRTRDKPNGRIDIVLWNKSNTPRALVEIKRGDAAVGLKADAGRVIDFIKACGKAYGGSVRYGVVATVLHGLANKPFAHLVAKANRRKVALEDVARREGMILRCIGPRPIHDPNPERDCRTASLVFTLAPPREK